MARRKSFRKDSEEIGTVTVRFEGDGVRLNSCGQHWTGIHFVVDGVNDMQSVKSHRTVLIVEHSESYSALTLADVRGWITLDNVRGVHWTPFL